MTGALGHIGSRLIRALPGSFLDAQIVLVDDLSTQRYASLFELPAAGRYCFVEADVLSADLDGLPRGPGAVVHLAAITNAEASSSGKRRSSGSPSTAPSASRARACGRARGSCSCRRPRRVGDVARRLDPEMPHRTPDVVLEQDPVVAADLDDERVQSGEVSIAEAPASSAKCTVIPFDVPEKNAYCSWNICSGSTSSASSTIRHDGQAPTFSS